MAEEPPEPEENGDADEPGEYTPFVDVRAAGDATFQVRAGYLDGENEIRSLRVNFLGDIGQAVEAFALAVNWYAEESGALQREYGDEA